MFLIRKLSPILLLFLFIAAPCAEGMDNFFSKKVAAVKDYVSHVTHRIQHSLQNKPYVQPCVATAQFGHKYGLILFNDYCLNLPHMLIPYYQYLQFGVLDVAATTQQYITDKLEEHEVTKAQLPTIKKMHEYLRNYNDYEIIKITNWILFVDELPFNEMCLHHPDCGDLLMRSAAHLINNHAGRDITLYKTVLMLFGYGLLYKSTHVLNFLKPTFDQYIFYSDAIKNNINYFFKPIVSFLPAMVKMIINMRIEQKEGEAQKKADQQSVDKLSSLKAISQLNSLYGMLLTKKINTHQIDKRIQWLVAHHNHLITT